MEDQEDQDVGVDERRDSPRVAMGETVTIKIHTDTIVGPGQNISAQGVFFIADAELRVSVSISGVAEPVDGTLVRVQHMGEGKLGIAVRFEENPNLPSE